EPARGRCNPHSLGARARTVAVGLPRAIRTIPSMKVGIAGFSGSGKSTVFHWLTGAAPDPSRSQQGQLGIATISDDRLTWLSQLFQPKKTTPDKLASLNTH